MNRHKHADIIHAWAEGAEIQLKRGNGSWVTVEKPDWLASLEYRIKPRIVKREGWVNVYNHLEAGNMCAALIYSTEAEARDSAGSSHVATVKISWEEEQ